jgi:hypothetical protein
LLAYLGAVALLSMASAHFSQSPKVMGAITPVHPPEWIAIERPFAAFALSIPEAADVPASYTIRRHAEGNGRKDILTLGEPDSVAPFLRVEIYRPGNEIGRYADPMAEMILSADTLGPTDVQHLDKPLPTKFGPLTIAPFITSKGSPRRCLGLLPGLSQPRLHPDELAIPQRGIVGCRDNEDDQGLRCADRRRRRQGDRRIPEEKLRQLMALLSP